MHLHWLPMCFRRREPETSGINYKNSSNNNDSNNTSSISKLQRMRNFFKSARANDAAHTTVTEHDHDHDKIEQSGSPDPASRPTLVPTARPSLLNSNALTAGVPRRTHSEQQHAEYLAKLEVPTLDQISSIAQVQEANERKLLRRYEEQETQVQKELDEEEEEAVKQADTAGENGAENAGTGLDPAQKQEREEEDSQTKQDAAGKIQRMYRGHRARREMAGLTLDPTTRWVEVLKSARYQNLTDPKKRKVSPGASASASPDRRPPHTSDPSAAAANQKSMEARSNWHHVSNIASHAMGEIPSDDTPKASMSPGRAEAEGKRSSMSKVASRLSQDLNHPSLPLSSSKKDKTKKKKKKTWAGKMMDLPYFLEMVDVKHRYGSNLRAYHAEWKKRDTHQNFFFWLDYGEGCDVEIDAVSRNRLEKEQVRYLSREERLSYLVKVDGVGRLIWAKNGQRITTSTDYRDSIDGIVPTDSKVKMFREDEIKEIEGRKASQGGSSSSDEGEDHEDDTDSEDNDDDDDDNKDDDASSSFSLSSATASPTSDLEVSDAERRYPDPPSSDEEDSDNETGDGNNPASSSTTAKQQSKKKKKHKHRASKKVRHVSAHAILNRLLRKTLSKNTWIFTADTSMNLYVGIKQSGSFQHSSFMNGSRISAAGTIKIKDGQLRALNPLSGHYRPPARAFRHFVRHLRAEHVDMSRVSISKSYAVLVGLEAYIGGRKKVQKAERKVKHGAGLVIHPAQARREREKEKDHSHSAEIERERTRREKGTLGRVLEDARERVEERWTALREPEVGQGGNAEGREGGEAGGGRAPAPAAPATPATQGSGKEGAAPAPADQDSTPSQTQSQTQKQTLEPESSGPAATTTTATSPSAPHTTSTPSTASPEDPKIPLPTVPDHQTGLDRKYTAGDQKD